MATVTEMNRRGLKAILVPTDFSGSSDIALGIAIDLAKQQSAKIYFLHVHQFRQSADENEMMQRQIAKFPEAKSVEIVPLAREGRPHEEIMKAQAEKHIDLIVIAGHGGKGFLSAHFRSVTEKIKRKAHCSVLVVGV